MANSNPQDYPQKYVSAGGSVAYPASREHAYDLEKRGWKRESLSPDEVVAEIRSREKQPVPAPETAPVPDAAPEALPRSQSRRKPAQEIDDI